MQKVWNAEWMLYTVVQFARAECLVRVQLDDACSRRDVSEVSEEYDENGKMVCPVGGNPRALFRGECCTTDRGSLPPNPTSTSGY
jgi:hypothetical protein